MHWYERSFRRNLLDFHVDDWHPDFLSRFDPVQFADSVLSLQKHRGDRVRQHPHGALQLPHHHGRDARRAPGS